jgi:hypothetical protein
MKKYLHGHDSMKNAYVIEDYPYGRLRTQMRVWVESIPKKGDRVYRQTLNPKNQKWNKPKQSTFSPIMFLYLDEKNHVHSDGISQYSSPEEVKEFIKNIGGEKKLNKNQQRQYDELSGKTLETEEPTWTFKFDRSVKENKVYSLDIKFDVASSLKLKSVIEALDSIIGNKKTGKYGSPKENFKKLIDNDGTIRIFGRRGVMIAGPMNAKKTYDQFKFKLKNKIKESILKETSNNVTSKPIGTPRGKAPYMKTDGVSDFPKSWEAKIGYWREMIEKMIGYETLE